MKSMRLHKNVSINMICKKTAKYLPFFCLSESVNIPMEIPDYRHPYYSILRSNISASGVLLAGMNYQTRSSSLLFS